jgi:ketosteroid isomerase-like protein
MSQENVEIVKEIFAAWANRDRRSATRHIHPDIHVDISPWTFLTRPADGPEGLRETFRELVDNIASVEFHMERLLDAGDHVVVALRVTGRGRESGIPVQREGFAVYTLREGLVVALSAYETLAGAQVAAGL